MLMEKWTQRGNGTNETASLHAGVIKQGLGVHTTTTLADKAGLGLKAVQYWHQRVLLL